MGLSQGTLMAIPSHHERPLISVPVPHPAPHPAPSEETEIFRRKNDFQMFVKAGVNTSSFNICK